MRRSVFTIGCIVAIAGAAYNIIDKIYGLLAFEEILNQITQLLENFSSELTNETLTFLRDTLMAVLIFSLVCNVIVLISGVIAFLKPMRKKIFGLVALIFSIFGLNIISLIGSILVLVAKGPEAAETRPVPAKEEAIVV